MLFVWTALPQHRSMGLFLHSHGHKQTKHVDTHTWLPTFSKRSVQLFAIERLAHFVPVFEMACIFHTNEISLHSIIKSSVYWKGRKSRAHEKNIHHHFILFIHFRDAADAAADSIFFCSPQWFYRKILTAPNTHIHQVIPIQSFWAIHSVGAQCSLFQRRWCT